MSEERFDQIDETLSAFRDRFESVDQRLVAIDRRFDEVDRRFDAVDRRFEAVDRRFEAVDQRFDDLERHMHVLHEDVIARIAAIPDNTARLEARMDRGFAELKEALDRRLDPLEAVVRDHSAALRRHDEEIDALKRRRR